MAVRVARRGERNTRAVRRPRDRTEDAVGDGLTVPFAMSTTWSTERSLPDDPTSDVHAACVPAGLKRALEGIGGGQFNAGETRLRSRPRLDGLTAG